MSGTAKKTRHEYLRLLSKSLYGNKRFSLVFLTIEAQARITEEQKRVKEAKIHLKFFRNLPIKRVMGFVMRG
jgi:hypothetical protein